VLTIDANQGYSLHDALELCERAAGLGIRWFEEPCVWSNDRRDMREVRARAREAASRCARARASSPPAHVAT
jgi:L-alanine-DL-glutamate epimerase-like enolase superfamily enzyme